MWSIREHVPIALMQYSRTRLPPGHSDAVFGKLFKFDVSVRIGDMSAFLSAVRADAVLAGMQFLGADGLVEHSLPAASMTLPQGYALRVCNFGHAGDQNLHLNILLAPSPQSGSLPTASPGFISEKATQAVGKALADIVYARVAQFNGAY